MSVEEERIVSGYCRQLDAPRRVCFEYGPAADGWRIAAADCAYAACPYAAGCPVAEQARAGESPER